MKTTPDLEEVLQVVADDLMESGAQAVVLRGSWVRGDALPESDVDLVVIGDGPPYLLERRGAYLISFDFVSAESWREMFHDPREVGGVIPGWRKARILRDPEGIPAALQAESNAWTWDSNISAIRGSRRSLRGGQRKFISWRTRWRQGG